MVRVCDCYNKVEIKGEMSTTKLIAMMETGVVKYNNTHMAFSKKGKIKDRSAWQGMGTPQTFGGGQIFPNKSSTRLAWLT